MEVAGREPAQCAEGEEADCKLQGPESIPVIRRALVGPATADKEGKHVPRQQVTREGNAIFTVREEDIAREGGSIWETTEEPVRQQ